MGALPDAVGAVVDALAIGEPIELGTLRRIVDPDAVEEADLRGLIRLDDLDERIEVRLAHPLVRGGAEEARGGDKAAATAGTVGDRACGCRRWRGCADAGSARGAEPRVGLGAGRQVTDPSGAGRDRLGGSGARRSAGRCGGAGGRRTGSAVPARACVVVAGPGTGSRGAAGRGAGRGVERRGAGPVHVSAGEQSAVGAGRSGEGERGDRRGRWGGRGGAGSQVDRRGECGVLVRDGPAGCRDGGREESCAGGAAADRRCGDGVGAGRRSTGTRVGRRRPWRWRRRDTRSRSGVRMRRT